MRRMTSQEGIEKLSQIHPSLDFSESQYVGNKSEITVKCPEHGYFTKVTNKMINPPFQGCPQCSKIALSKANKFSDDKVNTELEKRWGDQVRLKPGAYKGSNEYSTFICKDHGEFEGIYHVVRKAMYACPKCLREQMPHPSSVGRAVLLERIPREIRENTNIDEVDFKRGSDEIVVKCNLHGDFITRVTRLISGKSCPECGVEKRSKKKVMAGEATFFKKFREMYGDRYDLSHVNYTGLYNKVIVVCPDHGMFERSPNNLIYGNKGACPFCSGKYLCKDNLQKRIDAKHGEGAYTCGEVLDSITPFKVTCNSCGNEWMAKNSADMTKGFGRCLVCFPPEAKTFNKAEPGYLYNIRMILEDGSVIFKIGVTNQTPEERMRSLGIRNTVLASVIDRIFYQTGEEALNQELALKQQYKDHQFKGDSPIEDGWTELFVVNPFTYAKNST